jgi:hypothetical protein
VKLLPQDGELYVLAQSAPEGLPLAYEVMPKGGLTKYEKQLR